MKRKSISPEKAKFISSLLVTITFMVITLIASGFYTKRMLERARNQYFESLNLSTQGFAKILSTELTDYKDILSTFYLDYVFASEDTNQIFDFLKNQRGEFSPLAVVIPARYYLMRLRTF